MINTSTSLPSASHFSSLDSRPCESNYHPFVQYACYAHFRLSAGSTPRLWRTLWMPTWDDHLLLLLVIAASEGPLPSLRRRSLCPCRCVEVWCQPRNIDTDVTKLQSSIRDGGLYTLWAGLSILAEVFILLVLWKGKSWRQKEEDRESEVPQ